MHGDVAALGLRRVIEDRIGTESGVDEEREADKLVYALDNDKRQMRVSAMQRTVKDVGVTALLNKS